MKYDIKIPSMGESITEAHVGTIIKPTGSLVAMDDEILELETDKVNQVLYAPRAGTVTLTVKPEDVVKIGQVIGYVEEGAGKGETPQKGQKQSEMNEGPAAPPVKNEPQKADVKKTEHHAPSKTAAPQQEEEQEPARMTKDRWLEELRAPTQAAAAPKQSASSNHPDPSGKRAEKRTKMSKIRRIIAARLIEVQQNTAMLTTFNEVDMTVIMGLREKYKDVFFKEHGAKLGFMSFFVKACASALLAFPEINAYIDGEEIVTREYVDIGIAVGTEKGVIVPVVRDCDRLTFAEIEQRIEAYAKKAREGGLSLDNLQGGGFTITNGGVYGSLLSTPILNPPQCAILGMHKIMKRPMVVDDQIVIRQMMYLALSYDHRIVDGKEAVSFLVHVKNTLEDPSRLLLEV